MDDLDRRINEQVSKSTRKVYSIAGVLIVACLSWLVWGV